MPCSDAQRQLWIDASRGDRNSQQDLVRSQFAGAGWQTERFLSEMDRSPDYYLQPIQQIKMDRWSHSRVVCVGDAAYAPSPLTGSGAKLAMIGAYVLAGELSELKDGESPIKALEAYESKFRPFVEQVQEIPSFLPGAIHARSPWRIWLFQTAILVFSRIASLSFVRSRIGAQDPETNDDGFPLPYYSIFADKECR